MAVPYTFGTIIGGASIPLSELDDNFDYLATSPTFTGNVTVSGTFNVSGATTVSNTLNVLGAATLSNTLNVSGATVLSNTLSVSGSATFGSSLTLGNQQTVQGSLILANTAAGAYPTTIRSSNSASVAWTFTLPPTAGTNGYILTTNGSGASAWTNPAAVGTNLDVGTTAITGGATGRVLYDNAGVLGEYSLIPLSFGGTNANLTASNGGILYSTASATAILAGTSTANQILLSGSSAAPSWSTATYPSTTTINQILYSSSANTVTGLVTANGGVLNTNATGVPSVTTTPTIGVQQITQGRIILANTAAGAFQTTIQSSNSASAAWTLTLPATAGTNNYVLTTNGSGVSSWSQVSLTAGVTGTLPTGNGGTGIIDFTAANNAIYSTSASALTAGTLPIAAGGTGGTTDSQARTNLGLGTAAVKNTGTTADTIPLLDANGQLLNQRVAASAGWGAVTKSVGISNESGIYFDASNNSQIVGRNGAGSIHTIWQYDPVLANLVNGLPAYVCRAWVNFNGTGTPAIRAAGNVTSITDNGIGDYTINFAVAMTDVNYSAVSSTGNSNNFGTQPEAYNTGSFRLTTRNTGTAALSDNAYVNVAIFR